MGFMCFHCFQKVSCTAVLLIENKLLMKTFTNIIICFVL